jgi:predicted transcriptional regulator of viral defense system
MDGSCAKRPHQGRNSQSPPRDATISELALTQHGVVGLPQLVERGLTASAVRNRVASGRLHRVHRGVFAVGHARLTRNGRFMAAVLACGEGAVASHRAAATLLDLRMRGRADVDVTSPGSKGRGRAGIRAHSAATLSAQDVTVIAGVPCTTLARTLLDVAEEAPRRELERGVDRAEMLRLLDMRPIDDVLARAGGRRGAAALRAVLSEIHLGTTLTRSELEERFLEICRSAGLRPDGVNAWIAYHDGGGAEADFLWREQRLIVEVDGRDVHTTRRAFEHDRRRDQALMLLGWRVVRFTWRQVLFEPAYVAATLRRLLAQVA